MPTVEISDVKAWGNIDREFTDEEDDALQLAVDVATAMVVAAVAPIDEEDPDPVQESVMELAIIMQAFRLFKRRETPEGITAVFDGVAAMRVTSFDPDIARLLQIYPTWGVA